jgi:uncharacterized protein YjbJ (UPF0337 family)
MTINQETVNGKWLEIKGEIQKTWGKLTASELEQTKGDIKSIAGLVLQKYGVELEKFETKFSEITERFQVKTKSVLQNIKQDLKS